LEQFRQIDVLKISTDENIFLILGVAAIGQKQYKEKYKE
jgi:hypothetical protein